MPYAESIFEALCLSFANLPGSPLKNNAPHRPSFERCGVCNLPDMRQWWTTSRAARMALSARTPFSLVR